MLSSGAMIVSPGRQVARKVQVGQSAGTDPHLGVPRPEHLGGEFGRNDFDSFDCFQAYLSPG
jgi:hypothetical protein